ncbi:Hypothetical predicted protein [Pelobates cultripes]|uniref:Uncharacterized protein n=1 Tax=Pelobates cultripes TaxID=61616 RepID=A0AAD1WWY5_PELCU|nr:Hypothetical predicted protein [Pelobates cultripes]
MGTLCTWLLISTLISPALQSHSAPDPALQSHSAPDPALQSHSAPDPALQSHSAHDPALQSHSIPDPALQSHSAPDPALQSHSIPDPALQSHSIPDPALQSPLAPDPALQSPLAPDPVLQSPLAPDPVQPPSEWKLSYIPIIVTITPIPENKTHNDLCFDVSLPESIEVHLNGSIAMAVKFLQRNVHQVSINNLVLPDKSAIRCVPVLKEESLETCWAYRTNEYGEKINTSCTINLSLFAIT